MKVRTLHTVLGFSLFATIALTSGGCGNNAGPSTGSAKATVSDAADDSGWWCVEHGVPEEECSMCSTKAAAEFKKKGDWCKEHDRAESQCFICNPASFSKFAARYEAKFGKKPPTPEANTR